MVRIIFVVLVLLFMFFLIVPFLYPEGGFGFPATHPIDADCFGYKTETKDETGIKRISCYGYIYNPWLE